MTDRFMNHHTGLESPAVSLMAVAPDDGSDLPWITRAVSVEVPGVLRVTTADGSEGEIFVAAGMPFPIRIRRVWMTGTTATGIVALA